jgi:hypothetical protein
MPVNKKLYEEMQEKREAEHRVAERDRRRALVRTCLFCIMWSVLGLICYAFAFHTTDMGWAQIYQDGAYVITYGGITFTLARAYKKGEDRGDW